MCNVLKNHIDVEATISILQELITSEQPVLEAHQILDNEAGVMAERSKIAHLKNLLCFLRRCGLPH